MNPEDSKIKNLFEEMRREDQQSSPPFQKIWNEAERRSGGSTRIRKVRYAALAACTLLIVISITIFTSGLRTRMGDQEMSITQWKSPTDFLLSTPGIELIRSVPDFRPLPSSRTEAIIVPEKGVQQ